VLGMPCNGLQHSKRIELPLNIEVPNRRRISLYLSREPQPFRARGSSLEPQRRKENDSASTQVGWKQTCSGIIQLLQSTDSVLYSRTYRSLTVQLVTVTQRLLVKIDGRNCMASLSRSPAACFPPLSPCSSPRVPWRGRGACGAGATHMARAEAESEGGGGVGMQCCAVGGGKRGGDSLQ